MSCGVGHIHGSDPALLRLWHRLAAVAPIPLLAWELPYATGVALKTHTHTNTHTHVCTHTKVSLSDLVDTHTHTEVPLSDLVDTHTHTHTHTHKGTTI